MKQQTYKEEIQMRNFNVLIMVGLVVAVAVVAQAQPLIQYLSLTCEAGTPPKLTIMFNVLPDPAGRVTIVDVITADVFRCADSACTRVEDVSRIFGSVNQPLPFYHTSTHAAKAGKWYKAKVEIHYTIAGTKATVTGESTMVVCRAELVPTLTQWGLIALGLLLAASLAFMLHRLIRLVSLFYIGYWFPSAFEMAHLLVWQSLIIFFAVLFWLVWVELFVHRYEARRA